jgi:hypothetical protein
MKRKEEKREHDYQFRKECDQIELITGKKWDWVMGNYTLPELLRLKKGMSIRDVAELTKSSTTTVNKVRKALAL